MKQTVLTNEQSLLSTTSKNKDLQQVITSMNDILKLYQEKYAALSIKHETVTELNSIGTWDGKVNAGELTEDSHNVYNSIFREALGYENEEDFPSVLNSWFQTVSLEDKDRVSSAYSKLFTHDEPYAIDYRSENKDGSIEWVEVKAKVLRDEEGLVYRHIGTLRNIHEEKLNQLKVQELLSRLDLVEKSLHFSLNTLEGAWGIDLVNQESWYSPQFKRLLGYSDTDYFESSLETWFNHISHEHKESVVRDFNAYLYGHTDLEEYKGQFKMTTKNGSEKWFELTAQTSRDHTGKSILLAGVLRDSDHERQRQEENERIEQNMDAFMKTLNELAANIRNISKDASDLANENKVTVQSSEKARENIDSTQAVTNLIKEISEQTNLLGLNASIEAAQAGEHGRGFSVVAQEIQKLSHHTAEAVTKIEDILDTIKESVLKIVSSIETMSDKVQTQATITHDIDQKTHTINRSSKELLHLIKQLN